MTRRSFALVAVFGVVAALAILGPFPGTSSAPPSPAATPRTPHTATPPTPTTDAVPIRVSDRPVEGARSYVVGSWALVVHPRAPILDVTLAQVDAVLGVQAASWADLLGEDDAAGEGELTLLVQREASTWLADRYPLSDRVLETATAEEVLERVAAEPATVGLVDATLLDPRVRALTVEGWDPYRDAAATSPLPQHRWVEASTDADADAAAASRGWRDLAQASPVGFLATGELIPARCVQEVLSEHERGFDAMFDGTRDRIGAADLAMSHWEPSIVDAEATPCIETFNMSTLPAAADATAKAGVDVALAIGNHMGDCWSGCAYPDAVLETVEHLEAAGMLVGGAGEDIDAAREPVLTTLEGVTFAFLGYDEVASQHYGATEEVAGTAPLDLETLADDVRAAKARADHVIVGFSWGVEYVAEPTDRQREAAGIAIEAGASLVVGNHPHWVQATEWIPTDRGGAFVAYGLGNFVFDQDWSAETTQGAVLEVGFTRDRILGVRLRPTAVRERHDVQWVSPASEEGRAILGRMWDASDALPSRTPAQDEADETGASEG